jgi:hypothetical protein
VVLRAWYGSAGVDKMCEAVLASNGWAGGFGARRASGGVARSMVAAWCQTVLSCEVAVDVVAHRLGSVTAILRTNVPTC